MKLKWVKTPKIIKKIFSNYHWELSSRDNSVYITFDDGPIPEVTDWVLAQLKQYNAKATFFCIGDNIRKHPEVFQRIISSGHRIGNHTFNHLKGWQVSFPDYINNTIKCQQIIEENISEEQKSQSKLFRPPYGKITPKQSRALRTKGYKIIMWDVLSLDYDAEISPEECLHNVLRNVKSGSIIVFHDSIKAFPRLEYALPRVLEFLSQNGYTLKTIP